jgi:cytochrome c oxidase subunit 4
MAEHASHDHPSHAGRYLATWAALMALTAVTWWASRIHVGPAWHVAIALAIACVKGALVVLFFMHLYDQRGANRLVVITSLVFVALLVALTLADNMTRFPLATPPEAWKLPPPAGAP